MTEEEQQISLTYCNAQDQRANPLTKILPPAQWPEALCQLQVREYVT